MLVEKKEAFPVKMSQRDYTFWDSLILYGFCQGNSDFYYTLAKYIAEVIMAQSQPFLGTLQPFYGWYK
jgi:hypothetical protein